MNSNLYTSAQFDTERDSQLIKSPKSPDKRLTLQNGHSNQVKTNNKGIRLIKKLTKKNSDQDEIPLSQSRFRLQSNQKSKSPMGTLIVNNTENSQNLNTEQSNLEFIIADKLTKVREIGKFERLKQGLQRWLNSTEARRLKNMQRRHFGILNDKSIVIEEQFQKKIIKRLCVQFIKQSLQFIVSCFACFFRKPVHPLSTCLMISYSSECIHIILVVFMFNLYSFFDYYDEYFFRYFSLFYILVFAIYMLIRMNTAYLQHGVLINNRKLILKRYTKMYLFYDFITFVVLFINFIVARDTGFVKYSSMAIFLKLKVYATNFRAIEENISLIGSKYHLWQLFILLKRSLALCHVVAISYYFLAYLEAIYLEDSNNWVDLEGLRDKYPIEQYIDSFYWAIATVSLIGSRGQTTIETLFCITTLLFTVGVFATILSEIQIIISAIDQKIKDYKRQKDIMNSFFQLHNISQDLQAQMHNYLKYSSQSHTDRTTNMDFEELIVNFPQTFQDMIRKERYSKVIKEFKIISDKFSEYLIDQIINMVQEEYFMPNQIIFQQGAYQEPKIYLILSGMVEIYQEGSSKENTINILQAGQYFGEDQFFMDSIPQFSARSYQNSFTSILGIPRTKFENVAKLRNEDKETLQMIQEELQHKGFSNILHRKCYICDQKNHQEHKCNLLHYIPNINILVKRINFSQFQNRQLIERAPKNHDNAIKNVNDINTLQQLFLEQADQDIQQQILILQQHQLMQIQILMNIENDQGDLNFYLDDIEDDIIDEVTSNEGQESAQSSIYKSDLSPSVSSSSSNTSDSDSQLSVQNQNQYNSSNGYKNQDSQNLNFANLLQQLQENTNQINSQQQKNDIQQQLGNDYQIVVKNTNNQNLDDNNDISQLKQQLQKQQQLLEQILKQKENQTIVKSKKNKKNKRITNYNLNTSGEFTNINNKKEKKNLQQFFSQSNSQNITVQKNNGVITKERTKKKQKPYYDKTSKKSSLKSTETYLQDKKISKTGSQNAVKQKSLRIADIGSFSSLQEESSGQSSNKNNKNNMFEGTLVNIPNFDSIVESDNFNNGKSPKFGKNPSLLKLSQDEEDDAVQEDEQQNSQVRSRYMSSDNSNHNGRKKVQDINTYQNRNRSSSQNNKQHLKSPLNKQSLNSSFNSSIRKNSSNVSEIDKKQKSSLKLYKKHQSIISQDSNKSPTLTKIMMKRKQSINPNRNSLQNLNFGLQGQQRRQSQRGQNFLQFGINNNQIQQNSVSNTNPLLLQNNLNNLNPQSQLQFQNQINQQNQINFLINQLKLMSNQYSQQPNNNNKKKRNSIILPNQRPVSLQQFQTDLPKGFQQQSPITNFRGNKSPNLSPRGNYKESQNIVENTLNLLQKNDEARIENKYEFVVPLDKLYNFRFYFIYNNSEFTIPAYNKIQKKNMQKLTKKWLDKTKNKSKQQLVKLQTLKFIKNSKK